MYFLTFFSVAAAAVGTNAAAVHPKFEAAVQHIPIKRLPELETGQTTQTFNGTTGPPCGTGLGQVPCPPPGGPCGTGLGQEPCAASTTASPTSASTTSVSTTSVLATSPSPAPASGGGGGGCAGAPPEYFQPGMPCGPQESVTPIPTPQCVWQDNQVFRSWGILLPWNPAWMETYTQGEADGDMRGSLSPSTDCQSFTFFASTTVNVDTGPIYEAVFDTDAFCTPDDMSAIIAATTGRAYDYLVSCVEDDAETHPDLPDLEPGESEPEEEPPEK